MPLPLIVPLLAGAGALQVAGGIAQNAATRKYRKANEAQIDELAELERKGQLGLTPAEQRLLDQRLNAPVAAAAAEARSRAEQLGAAQEMTGADAARLREEQTRATARGAQEAALQVIAADEQKAAQQKAELEQRMAVAAQQKADTVARTFGSAAEATAAGAQIAGAMPGTFKLSQALGSRFSSDQLGQLEQFWQDNPEEANRLFSEMLAKARAGAQ